MPLKIALKYGIATAVCFMAWVAVAHWLVPDPSSGVHSGGAAAFVNMVEIVAIFLGIRESKAVDRGRLRFKDGLKTGVSIAAVYAGCACVFFLIALKVLGAGMLAVEPGAALKPMWQVALGAFLGLGVGAVLFGLLYAAVISFFLTSRSR
jgi:hypothetical protein